MKSVIATALVLVTVLFLAPMLLLGGAAPVDPEGDPPPPTATLPPAASPAPLRADGARQVRIKREDGGVEQLAMDAYLWRVVAAEMPASFEPEALKAQTVTARTYSLWKMAGGSKNHPDADLCTDITCCQAYIEPDQAAEDWGDAAERYTAKIAAAVSETDGQAILYQGAPIDAVFFSSAAGRTEDAVSVWGGDLPYLASVESPEGEEVPNYRTRAAFSLAEARGRMLDKYPQADLSGAPETWLGAVTRTPAGSVDTMVIGGQSLEGTEVRALFSLRSASFTAAVEGEELVFSVTGYGHGVGMSQYGANAMARSGKGYEEILTWYYTGVEIGSPQA